MMARAVRDELLGVAGTSERNGFQLAFGNRREAGYVHARNTDSRWLGGAVQARVNKRSLWESTALSRNSVWMTCSCPSGGGENVVGISIFSQDGGDRPHEVARAYVNHEAFPRACAQRMSTT